MASRPAPSRSPSRLLEFLRTEEASGVFLLAATVLALVWVNSPMRESYVALWSTEAWVRGGDMVLEMDLQHWVNEGLMTFFFLVVGLEIKREIVVGELREPKKLMLPVFAALGGMIVPAGIYLLFNAGTAAAQGWGVPVATDIAFALGILTLAAAKAPLPVRSFLLTLAIVDDIGAIVLIALFYSSELSPIWLLSAAAVILVIEVAKRRGVDSLVPYIALGTMLWLALYHSGIHPTLAGVILGLLTPATPLRRSASRYRISSWLFLAGPSRERVSPLERVEPALHPWTTRAVVPIFALANAGVEISSTALIEAVTSPVGLGIIAGLVVGKPLGIIGAVWIATRSGLGQLSNEVTPRMILGVAALAGVGFTVALFIAELAFIAPRDVETSKLAILLASVAASLLGSLILAAPMNGRPQQESSGHANRRIG